MRSTLRAPAARNATRPPRRRPCWRAKHRCGLLGKRPREPIEGSRSQALSVAAMDAAGADTLGMKDKRADDIATCDSLGVRVEPSLRVGANRRDGEWR